MHKKEKLKTVLLGYDKKSVDLFLKKLHRMQEEELQELKNRIAKARIEKERLAAEVARFEDRTSPEASKELLELTKQQLQESMNFFQEQGESHEMLSKQPNAIWREPGLETQRNNKKIVSLLEKVKSTESTIPDADLGEKGPDEENANSMTFHNEKRELEDIPLELEDQSAYPATSPSRENTFFSNLELETVHDPLKLDSIEEKYNSNKLDSAKAAPISTFWGDMEQYNDDGIEVPGYFMEQAAGVEIMSKSAAASELEEPEFPMSEEMFFPKVDHATTATSDEKNAFVPEMDKKEVAVKSNEPTAVQDKLEEKVPADSEMQAMKNRYIVGKMAGEDILDRQGRVLIAKHSVITETSMQLAEREGKLVELIVNMIIPGMEE